MPGLEIKALGIKIEIGKPVKIAISVHRQKIEETKNVLASKWNPAEVQVNPWEFNRNSPEIDPIH